MAKVKVFVTDRQTDRQTDGQTIEIQCAHPFAKAGDNQAWHSSRVMGGQRKI